MSKKFVDAIRYHLLNELESAGEATQRLFDAILAGDRDRIKENISLGANTQLLDENGQITPLGKIVSIVAVESSNTQIIEYLLQGNARISTNKIDETNQTTERLLLRENRDFSELTKEYQIGSYSLAFPANHPLDLYQSTCHRYDRALGYIAQAVFRKYPDSCAIDIGANVGDTAALIQKYQSVATLCIEGNPQFLDYLIHNATIIGNIEIEKCFIGRDGTMVNLENVKTQRGTASIVNAINTSSNLSVQLKSLHTILHEHPRFQNFKLLKIDTDGFDFSIIMEAIDIIKKLKPVLHFEYATFFTPTDSIDGLNAVAALVDCGYQKFIIYDNYGNYLMSLSNWESEKFIDLNAYLASNHRHSNRVAVHYLDICAFSGHDIDLFDEIRQIEISRSDEDEEQ